MSLGGENLAGFLRGFGGLLQLNNGLQGVEILGARSMPSAAVGTFRAASAIFVDPETGEVVGGGFPEGPLEPMTPIRQPGQIFPGVANEILIALIIAMGGVAFAVIFGDVIAREVRKLVRM